MISVHSTLYEYNSKRTCKRSRSGTVRTSAGRVMQNAHSGRAGTTLRVKGVSGRSKKEAEKANRAIISAKLSLDLHNTAITIDLLQCHVRIHVDVHVIMIDRDRELWCMFMHMRMAMRACSCLVSMHAHSSFPVQ